MKPFAWTVASFLAAFTLAPAPVSARPALPSQTVAEKTADAVDKTKDAVVTAAKTTTQKTKDGLSKTGEVMTDGWITTRVHARFVNEALLHDSDISVEANDHVVTLKGTVLSRNGRARAAAVAKSTEGVRRVVNRLTVGPKR